MESIFHQFFNRRFPSLFHWSEAPEMGALFEFDGQRLPSLDVVDRDSEVLVRAEIPGIDKKDLSITLADNQLTIKGQASSETEEEKGDYYRHEISKSSFARSVSIPGNLDTTKSVASLKDGVLEVTLPKLDSSKRRNIPVR